MFGRQRKYYRRKGFRRRRFRATKFVIVWVLLLLVALYSRVLNYCNTQGLDCNELIYSVLSLVALSFFVFCIIFVFWKIIYILRERRRNQTPGFATQPWTFNNQTIELSGKVTYVFVDKASDSLRLKLTNLWRTIIASGDPSARYQHQRFLLTSPGLRKGETVLVLCNLNFETPQIRRGDHVEVKGIYIHAPSTKRSFWGLKKTFYGKVHYTHPPKGYIKKL